MNQLDQAVMAGLSLRQPQPRRGRGGLNLTHKQAHALNARRRALNEKRMTKGLQAYFSGVIDEVCNRIAKSGGSVNVTRPRAEAKRLIKRAFNADEHLEGLVIAANKHMTGAFFDGALTQAELGRRAHKAMIERVQHKEIKSTASDLLEELGLDWPDAFGTEPPQWLIDEATDAMTEALSMDYWQDIVDNTAAHMMKTAEQVMGEFAVALEEGVSEGLSMRSVAERIREIRGPDYAHWRAMATARTEVGYMLNRGAAAGIRRVQDETGLAMGKEWNSVFGSTSRQTHMDFDATQTSGPDELFSFPAADGNIYEVDAPSDPRLPPEERIACQCFLLSTIVSDELSPDQDEE